MLCTRIKEILIKKNKIKKKWEKLCVFSYTTSLKIANNKERKKKDWNHCILNLLFGRINYLETSAFLPFLMVILIFQIVAENATGKCANLVKCKKLRNIEHFLIFNFNKLKLKVIFSESFWTWIFDKKCVISCDFFFRRNKFFVKESYLGYFQKNLFLHIMPWNKFSSIWVI